MILENVDSIRRFASIVVKELGVAYKNWDAGFRC